MSAPAIESIPADIWNAFPRPGKTAQNVVEYRNQRGGDWVRSYMAWSTEEIAFFNRACGYERYRVARVVLA